MKRFLLSAVMLVTPLAVNGADDLKVSQLEQDLRNLQRQVQAMSQQIDEIRLQLARPAQAVRSPPLVRVPDDSAAAGSMTGSLWLDTARWRRVKPGMSELDVVNLLGPPASMRTTEGARVLFYAMEIGSSGFLRGSVTMRERVVVKVQEPALE